MQYQNSDEFPSYFPSQSIQVLKAAQNVPICEVNISHK